MVTHNFNENTRKKCHYSTAGLLGAGESGHFVRPWPNGDAGLVKIIESPQARHDPRPSRSPDPGFIPDSGSLPRLAAAKRRLDVRHHLREAVELTPDLLPHRDVPQKDPRLC